VTFGEPLAIPKILNPWRCSLCSFGEGEEEKVNKRFRIHTAKEEKQIPPERGRRQKRL